MTHSLQLQFLGAAGTVTGSKTLVQYGQHQVLVDCGLFQGLKELRLQNWDQFPVKPASIEALLLTHAHLDHCGHIPALVNGGFNGAIHCTPPTQALAKIILEDSAKIQEEEAERANRYGYTKHDPAKPLYNREDVQKSLPLFVPHGYHEWVIVNNEFKFQFLNAGHILGSAMVELRAGEKTILFSGDLGRAKPLLLPNPERVRSADALVIESTYGDRLHPEEDTKEVLLDIIEETFANGGILIVPTFAVERAQELLFLLSQLKNEGRLPNKMPIYLDSPMGVSATEVMLDSPGWHRLSHQEIIDMDQISHLITDAQTSRSIVNDPKPKIVLAGSGMITGGRVLHYLNNYLSDERTTVLLVGFQAEGTRGRSLEEGATELKFFGQYVPVKANIRKINSLSAHADQGEILDWLGHFKVAPKKVFLNHGEKDAAEGLKAKIEAELHWDCEVVQPNHFYPL